MKSIKDIIFIGLSILLVILILTSIVALFHTIYFAFTHIHLTRMEMIFDPNNYMIYKSLVLVAAYIVFVIISKWS